MNDKEKLEVIRKLVSNSKENNMALYMTSRETQAKHLLCIVDEIRKILES